MSTPIRAITLEEHAAFPSLGDKSPFYDKIWEIFPERQKHAWDHSEKRIADMDNGNVSIQVMSHLPGIGVSDVAGCRAANEEMAQAVQRHPDRFRGFAVLPMMHPMSAAEELKRAVTELGFCGALVDNHVGNMIHYDDEKFWPVFEEAERLDVPIYLHPAPPSDEALKQRFEGSYPMGVTLGLATGAWGWHEDVGLHILKLYAAGLFERFPRLKILIGHMGELLPCMIDRIERLEFFKKMASTRKKGMKKVWEENIWVTTSGIFSINPMATLLKVTPVDHILFSVDYPFESNVSGREFLNVLASSGLVTEEEIEKIAYKNAEMLLRLN